MIEAPESVLVMRFSALGDVVLTSPAIEALHAAWPETRILFATKARYLPLVAHNPNVHEVVPLADGEGALSFARRLGERRIGAVLDLHDKLRSRIVRRRLAGAPTSVWRKRDLAETLLVKLALQPHRARVRTADGFHAAVERLVGRALPRGRLRHHLGPNDLALADAALAAVGLHPKAPLLGLSPGATWATKRWPAERFAELARRALAAGFQVAVQGSSDEAPVVREVCTLARGAVDLSGQLDLRALGGFIARCRAFVANDSGPMHLARGLGIPTLALFGSTDPAMFDFAGHAVQFAGVACAPCSPHGRSFCPRGNFACMNALDVDSAWRTLLPLLEAGPRALLSA